MFDILEKYRAIFFAKAVEIVPSPDVISTLLNMFSDKGLLPTTFQEIGPQSRVPLVRLRLNSPNNEWGINFASDHIDIEKNLTLAAARNMGDVADFTKDAKAFFSRILEQFKKKGHRLAIITTGMLQEMTDKQLSNIFTKLFRPLPFYKRAMPFEWNARCVSKSTKLIGEASESINVITSINRIQGQLSEPDRVTQFDRIQVAFDINTAAENDDNRFTAESFKDFFDSALQVRSEILDQIQGIVNG